MSEPIRILQVLGRLDRGGAETMIMNLYRRMDRSKIQFDFVIHTTDVCDYTEEVLSLGGRIFPMEPFNAKNAFGYRGAWRAFFRVHPEFKVVHGHMRSTASIYLAEAKRACRKTIAHSHNTSSGKGISAMVKNVLQRSIKDKADYLFACSKSSGVWLYGEDAVQENRFSVLHNGIDCDRFAFSQDDRDAFREKLKIAPNTKVILHVGRMELQKNHSFLLDVAAKINELGNAENPAKPNYIFLLCGEGPLESQIREKVAALKLDDCMQLLGIRKDMPALMQAADLMLFPSLFEGLPVTLVEAQATGLPILMSDAITDEVVLTNLIEKMPLSQSATEWAKKAMDIMKRETKPGTRISYASKIMASGYDVNDTAKWLAQFYTGLWN